jgi:tetratricopeptide (TPR) repeat protein
MNRQYMILVVIMIALVSACTALPPATLNEQAPRAPVMDEHEHDHAMGLPEQLGEVHFAVSCTPEAQAEFNHGMALLHSFWFAPAIESFNTVAALDPTCGMAHWGVAMSLLGNPFTWPLAGQTLVDGWAAVEMAMDAGAQTPREAAYIDAVAAFYQDAGTVDHRTRALAYTQAMEALAQDYPEDTEAVIFYALALNATALPTDKTYANQRQAVEILAPIFVEQPNHPGVAHYLIHSTDSPVLAAQGVDAAMRYADIAPAAPHALHMPSHIFTRLGNWQESIDSNIASVKAARGELVATDQPVAGYNNALHGMDYLMYAYLQQGRDDAAKAVLDDVYAIDQLDATVFVAAYAFAAMPARYTLERGQWAEAAALALHPPNLAWENVPQAEAVLVFARGLGAARAGDVVAAQQDLERLHVLQEAMLDMSLGYWAEQAEIQIEEIAAWIALAEGKPDEALASMHRAAELEAATEKHPVTPGPIVPAQELFGDMLLALDKPDEALAEYEASHQVEPNRFRGLYGAARAAELAGDLEKAQSYYEQLAVLAATADGDRAELVAARAFLVQ